MNKFALIAFAAALTGATALADAATLRTDTSIDGDTVRLGHLFDDVGDRADAAIGRAPSPGRKAVYDAAYLARIAQGFQISWQPASNFDRAVITRTSTLIDAERVRDILTPALAARIGADRIDVSLDNRQIEVHLPADQPGGLVVDQLSIDQFNGRFSAMLVGRDPSAESRIPVSGRATAIAAVPVLTRRIKPGEVIEAADIAWLDMRETRSSTEVIRGQEQLIGLTPRRTITANTPIRPGDVREPQVVMRNSLVTISLQTRSIGLTAQGRALQEGAMGETVRVVNTMSNRTIEATVTGPNQVTVSMPGARAIN